MKERRTLVELITNYPEERKDDDVLIFLNDKGIEYKNYSFEELRRDCSLAAFNITKQTEKNEIILLAIEDQALFVAAFFGCLIAGRIPAPIGSIVLGKKKKGWGRTLNILNQYDIKKLIVEEENYDLTTKRLADSELNDSQAISAQSLLDESEGYCLFPTIEPTDTAYIQFSSGSTAQPKGIVLTHQQVMNNMTRMLRVFDRDELGILVGWLPFYHDMGLVGHLFTVLFEAGKGIFLPPISFLSKPGLWLEMISKYRATMAASPTFAFDHCVSKIEKPGDWDLSCWKYVYVGSETVSLPILNRFVEKFASVGFSRKTFRPVYGLAEATLLAAGGHMDLTMLEKHCEEKPIGNGLFRKLIPYSIDSSVNIAIHDIESKQPLAEGQEGEIWLDCDSNFIDYLDQVGEGKKPETNLVKTGDLGYISNGYLYITGRIKEIVIIRGVNYSAEDLEHCCRIGQTDLNLNDQIACVSKFDVEKEKLFVFVEAHRHLESHKLESIINIVQANLSEHFNIQADVVAVIPQGLLPRTSNFKIARSLCTNKFLSGDLKILHSYENQPIKKAIVQKEEDSVVVVGMACRFPGGANTLDDFWQILENGTDAITEVPEDRWNNSHWFDKNPAVPGKTNSKWGGFIDDIDQFDPTLFGISSYEAPEIDPQQRLIMETSWRAFENAGWKNDHLKGSNTGVFMGISTNDYLYMKIKSQQGMEAFNAYSGLGNSHSIAANRVSFFYDFKGPSVAVDTACSSSLTAFHMGTKAILNGDCEQSVVGGVNAILSPGITITLSQTGMMSPEGRCKTFDDSADGYVRSEGCGIVLLKSKAAAIRDGDKILAEVKMTSISQDGSSMDGNRQGITFPNGKAQYQLLKKTVDKSGLNSNKITYIEAHGTGTAAGDPIEMSQLKKIYGKNGKNDCHVGSVKANIGHLESAAGIAGVIKVILMLKEKKIPPQIHIKNLNPKINLEDSRLKIATELKDWSAQEDSRMASISSFGFGGSLAHVILEENTTKVEKSELKEFDNYLYPFVLSGYSQGNLKMQAEQWQEWLTEDSEKDTTLAPLEQICSARALHRYDFNYRKYFLVEDKSKLLEKLKSFIYHNEKVSSSILDKKLCYLFTGQGEHYIRMGKELYYRFPVFRKSFDRCVDSLKYDDPDFNLKDIAFDDPEGEDWKDQFVQPLLFATQYSLCELLASCGVQPDVLLGHSLGEYAAACVAGCFEPEEGMQILRKRGELVEALSEKGYMATVFTSYEEVEKVLDLEKAQIAAINSGKKTVISGEDYEVMRVCRHFKELGIDYYTLRNHQGYHSHYMDPMMEEYRAYLKTFNFKYPTKKWMSSVTASWMTEELTADYWVNHLRNTVRFSDAVESLDQLDTAFNFIEIGPGASTLVAVNDTLGLKESLLLRTLTRSKVYRPEEYYFLDALGKLYQEGYNINWESIYKTKQIAIEIPGHKFAHKSYWLEGLEFATMPSQNRPFQGSKKLKKKTNGMKSSVQDDAVNLHFTLEWEDIGEIADVDLREELSKDISWIIIGKDSELLESTIQLLRTYQKSVHWIGTDTSKRLKPDFLIDNFENKEQLLKKIDEVINYKSKRNIDVHRLLFICDETSSNQEELTVEALNEDVKNTVGAFTILIQALKEMMTVVPVWIISQNAQAATDEEYKNINLSHAPIWGFSKTAYLEHPECRGGIIDVSTSINSNKNAKDIICKIIDPLNERGVLLRNGKQYIEKIIPSKTDQVKGDISFRSDGAFIVTGGVGGLGLKSAEWLADNGARHLILMSRRVMPEQSQWESLDENHQYYEIVKSLKTLKNKVDKLDLVSCDVRNLDEIEGLFNKLDNDGIPIRGVLHAAGVNWFSKIVELDHAELLETMKIKVATSFALHQLTKNRDLDCFILYSSISAIWGSVSLGHYTAANYFLDMLSLYRKQLGLPSLCIDWGPWAEVGMSSGQQEAELFDKLGFNLMPPKNALAAMGRELEIGRPLSMIGDFNWLTFKPFIDFSLRPSLFKELLNTSDVSDINSQGVDKILNSTPDIARNKIEEVVRIKLRSVMLIESMEKIDDQHRFNFFGMDSLMAISFVVELEQYFNVKLPSTLPYNYPHIRAVSDFLFEEIYKPTGKNIVENEEIADQKEVNGHLNGKSSEDGEFHEVLNGKMVEIEKQGWFVNLNDSTGDNEEKIFFFPYAGSGVLVYKELASHLPDNLDAIGVQYPGRENRSEEEPYGSISKLVASLVEDFQVPEENYHFFGHSMGGLIAYELYQTLKESGAKLPSSLILSGCTAPIEREQGNIHQLVGAEFVDAVLHKFENDKNLENRRTVIESTEMLLKSDIQLLETHKPSLKPVDAPLILVAGINDEIAPTAQVKEWISLAQGDLAIYNCPGSHDIIHENQDRLLEIITESVNKYK